MHPNLVEQPNYNFSNSSLFPDLVSPRSLTHSFDSMNYPGCTICRYFNIDCANFICRRPGKRNDSFLGEFSAGKEASLRQRGNHLRGERNAISPFSFRSTTTQRRSRHRSDTVSKFHAEAPHATAAPRKTDPIRIEVP